MRLRPGSGFTDDQLADDVRRIIGAYKSLGRPYVTVDFSGITWNEDKTRVRLRLTVAEGLSRARALARRAGRRGR